MVGFSPGDYGHPQGARATGLADRWSMSDGGRVWTFHIRSGVTWQDGVPLTAHDVAFTYNYVIKNQLSNYTMYVNFIKSVVAPNDNTVVFTCTKPKANMLNAAIPIVPQHIWASIPGDQAASMDETPPIVGSGPFQLTSYDAHKQAELTANRDYWGGVPRSTRSTSSTTRTPPSSPTTCARGFCREPGGSRQARTTTCKTTPACT